MREVRQRRRAAGADTASRRAGVVIALLLSALASASTTAARATTGPTVEPRQARRGFAMGFSTFPHSLDGPGLVDAMARIRDDADLALVHEDGGVPWEEAATGAPFPAAWEQALDFYAASIEPGHRVLLAVTPLNGTRSGLALNRGDGPHEPLPPGWEGRSLGHPRVIRAFIAYCMRMVDRFQPDWLAFSVEANMLRSQSPEQWSGYAKLARRAYRALKRRHPDLPLMQTLQLEFFLREPEDQARALRRILPYTDLMAISTYAFGNVSADADPRALPADYFDALLAVAPDKPFAVAETAWPAEDIDAPYPGHIAADPAWQARYVRWLLGQARRHDAEFVAWVFARDYDAAWEDAFRLLPEAPTLRIWRDTGLFAGDGTPRQALRPWRRWLRKRTSEPAAGRSKWGPASPTSRGSTNPRREGL